MRLSHIFRKAKDCPEADLPITIFSGDAFSPSLESAVMKGEHMVPILNHLIDIACYRNHDFDVGENALAGLSKNCTFPWLLANAVRDDGRLLAAAKEYLILEKEGYRIGFFGLTGTDWPSNFQHLPTDCTILNPALVARCISNKLRTTLGVDIVIAPTHMCHEEDVYLVQQCDADIDLILGGHDHNLAIYGSDVNAIGDAHEGHIKLVKLGTDFKNFSSINVHLTRTFGNATVEYVKVTQMRDITLEDHFPKIVPLFYSSVPLDGRTDAIRTRGIIMGNMLADAVRAYYNTDVALINFGSVRCDRIMDAGVITVKDMIDILPFDNPFVVKRLRGDTIATALENAACDIIDGRFFQVSGIEFCIDSRRPVGARAGDITVYLPPVRLNALVRDPDMRPLAANLLLPVPVPMSAEAKYTVAMIAFIADGFDGYTLFRDIPNLVDVEGAMTDSSLFLQIFRRDMRDACETALGSIDTAYATIVPGRTPGGLPLVSPTVQRRIMYVD